MTTRDETGRFAFRTRAVIAQAEKALQNVEDGPLWACELAQGSAQYHERERNAELAAFWHLVAEYCYWQECRSAEDAARFRRTLAGRYCVWPHVDFIGPEQVKEGPAQER